MKRSMLFAILIVGFTSIVTQIVLLREAISGFYGNELLLGIILGNWLLLTGIGSYLGKYCGRIRNKLKLYTYLLIAIAVLTPLTVFLIKIIRNLIAVPGELVGLLPVILYSFIILAPFCLISGFQYTLASSIIAEKRKDKVFEMTNVYILDSIGDLSGGLIFSYFLIFIFNSFQALYVAIFLNLFAAFLLSMVFKKRKIKYLTIALTLFFIVFLSLFNLQRISTKLQYPNQNLVFEKNSIYGHLVVTEKENQLNFYENGFPLFNTLNIFSNEEVTHYAILQHPDPKNVLLISGGASGTTNEILKYNISLIDYVELDPLIIEIGKRYTTNLDNNKIKIHNIDGRLFVKQTNKKYDVVIIDLPDPDSVQVNRFYTIEFFSEIKRILNSGGIISLSLGGGENYLSEEAKKLNSAIYQTLNIVFNNIIIIPGRINYYVASDSVLDYNYKERIKEKGIETKYMEFYLDGKITQDRIDYIFDAVKEKVPVNKDFRPISHYFYLGFWLSMFNVNYNYIVIGILIIIIFILYLIRIKPVPFTIFVTGFSGVALEVVIIVAFQILYGYVYHKIGVIITAFMVGLAIGAFLTNRLIRKKVIGAKTLARFDGLMVLYAVLLPLAIILLSKVKDPALIFLSVQIIIPILTILIGILVGIEFPLAVKIHFKKKKNVEETTGILYGADLFGAFVGAYVVSVLLIPQYGIIAVSLIVGALNLISGIYLWFSG